MTVKRLHKGSRMSQIVIYNRTIYLAGQVGTGSTVGEQTADMLAKVDRLLNEAGASKSNILSAMIWLSDMANFAEMNLVWDNWIDSDNPPARACGEARLATAEHLVEVVIVAAKPD